MHPGPRLLLPDCLTCSIIALQPRLHNRMRKMPGSAAKKNETGYNHQNRNNNYTEQLSSKSKRVNSGLCKIIVVYS